MKQLATLFAVCLCLVACKKNPNESNTSFYLANTYGQPVKFKLYPTLTDLFNETNTVYSGEIQANDTVSIATSLFSNENLFIDYYNADYTLTNWHLINPNQSGYKYDYSSLSKASGGWNNAAHPKYLSVERMACIQGNSLQSEWRAIDFLKNGTVSTWAALSQASKDVTITLKKDYSGTLHIGSHDKSFNYVINGNQLKQVRIDLLDSLSFVFSHLTSDLDNGSVRPYNDTLYMEYTVEGAYGDYVLIKQ